MSPRNFASNVAGAFRKRSDDVISDAKKELGANIYQLSNRLLVTAQNIEITNRMLDPKNKAQERLTLCETLIQINLDAMDTQNDTFTQKTLYHYHGMLELVMEVAETEYAYHQLLLLKFDPVLYIRYLSLNRLLQDMVNEMVIDAIVTVNNKAHGKPEHVPNTIVVSNPVIQGAKYRTDDVYDKLKERGEQSEERV